MAESVGGGNPKGVKQILVEGAKEGVQKRVENKVAGSGSSSPSVSSVSSGGASKFLIFLIFLIIGGYFLWPTVTDCMESGFCKTRIIEPVKTAFKPVGETFSFIGKQAGESAAIIRGEKTFSWEGDVEERKKAGIWFEGGKTYGITLSETESGVVETLSGEFGAVIDVVVGKIDENLKEIEANIGCSLEEHEGIIRGNPEGKLILDNPYPEDERTYRGSDCVFTEDPNVLIKKKVDKDQVYFLSKVIFNLNYSLNPEVYLPVFVIPKKEIYDEFRGRPDEAFKELAFGQYKEYSSDVRSGGIKSTMIYMANVGVVMRLVNQPLGLNVDQIFGVQFRNKDIKNKASFKGFVFTLPDGLNIGGSAKVSGGDVCDYFEPVGTRSYKFKEEFFDRISKQLNTIDGETDLFLCKVDIDNAFSEASEELANLGDIEGKLSYDYTISEEVTISN
ncbi:MAG: hypothetical protein KKG75_00690 [Nanoarchaeota archaeon]|nr:hypothetical protein [Nanoarchaeota archaeon]